MNTLITTIVIWFVTYLPVVLGTSGGILSVIMIYQAIKALRIKNQVRYLLHERYKSDPKFRLLLDAAIKDTLSAKELQEASFLIEKIANELAPYDREVIEKGLHQVSSVGTERYISNLLKVDAV